MTSHPSHLFHEWKLVGSSRHTKGLNPCQACDGNALRRPQRLFPEARAQAKSFGSVLAVRAVQPRIAVTLETRVLGVGLSGGVEEAHLRDWRLLDHRSSNQSCTDSVYFL